MFDRILIAVDGSAPGRRAVEAGRVLAERVGARAVGLVHAINPPPPVTWMAEVEVPVDDEAAAQGRDLLHDYRHCFPDGVHVDEILVQGRPGEQIPAAAADWAADVIVVGTHGRHGVSRFLLGSVAESVVRTAPCPVLVAREQTTADPKPAALAEIGSGVGLEKALTSRW